jgi:hypothetical protein
MRDAHQRRMTVDHLTVARSHYFLRILFLLERFHHYLHGPSMRRPMMQARGRAGK